MLMLHQDGPEDLVIATGETVGHGKSIGLAAAAYLAANDSYHFFEKLGDLIVTGPTGTNVNDLMFIIMT